MLLPYGMIVPPRRLTQPSPPPAAPTAVTLLLALALLSSHSSLYSRRDTKAPQRPSTRPQSLAGTTTGALAGSALVVLAIDRVEPQAVGTAALPCPWPPLLLLRLLQHDIVTMLILRHGMAIGDRAAVANFVPVSPARSVGVQGVPRLKDVRRVWAVRRQL